MSAVDVVVPCYNYALFLRECVRSALDQPGVDVRVLVIDDASQDDTAVLGAQLATGDSRVQFRRHERNRGHIATYNEGLLDWATAEYCVLLSADDMLAPGALHRATRLLDAHPEAGMAYGMALLIDAAGPPNAVETEAGRTQVIPGAALIERTCARGNCVPTPSAVVRTRLQRQLGGYDPTLPHTGDMEMWMRFAASGPVGVLSAVQSYYRKHGQNMSSRYYAQVAGDRLEQLQAGRKVFTRWGRQIPGFTHWLEAMALRLADATLWAASQAFDAGDLVACNECIRIADEMYPGASSSRRWWRFRIKRLVGPATWSHMRSLRPLLSSGERRDAPGATEPPRRIGWWPQLS